MSARMIRIRAERAQKRALKAQQQQQQQQQNVQPAAAPSADQQQQQPAPWKTMLANRLAIHDAEAANAVPVTLPSGDTIPEPGTPLPVLSKITSSASPAQLAANRANAQLSTGPKSQAGVLASSQNRTSHGLARHRNGEFRLLTSEDPQVFAQLKSALESEHAPQTETESILVNHMAESTWLAQRAQNLQATCTNPDTGEITDAKMAALYLRYETTHTRAFHKALNDLVKLRKEKRQAENGFEAQKRQAAKLAMDQDRFALKKQQQYWNLALKDAQTCHQMAENLRQQHAAGKEDPSFDFKYAAELAARGLKSHSMGAAIAA